MAAVMLQQLRAWLLACPLRLRRRACILHLGLIAVLSLLPPWFFPSSPVQIPGLDKWVHGAMYGVLGAMLRWAAGRGSDGEAPSVSRWLPLAAGGYGLLMEFLQLELTGGARMFSWGDAAANLTGAVLFWVAAGQFLKNKPIYKKI